MTAGSPQDNIRSATNGPTTVDAILQQAREAILNRTMWAIAVTFTFAILLGSIVALLQGNLTFSNINLLVGGFVSLIILWGLTFSDRFLSYKMRTRGMVGIIYITALLALFSSGLMGPFRYNLLATVILGAVFLGRKSGLILTAVATVTALLGGFLLQQGFIVTNTADTLALANGEAWLVEMIRFTAVTSIIISVSFQLIREAQRAFIRQQSLTQKLAEERASLDKRIEERTRALRLTAEVSRTLVMILDKDQLVLEVVEQIQKTFNYYHVHIYLLDPHNEEQLLMAGGTGEAGKALLIGKHKISVGQGLVGRAALMGVPILVADVRTDKYWLPNPLLPETRSEIAVPIIHENKVIGVLDVQEDNPHSLGEADVDLLETISNQLGVALNNADLYARRTTQALRQARLNEISTKIQIAPDIETTLQVAVRELGETLRVNRTSIILNPPSTTKPNLEIVNQFVAAGEEA